MQHVTYNRKDFDSFLGTLKYTPNDFQLKVLESVAFGTGNIQVSAVAGSGKTSMIVMIVALVYGSRRRRKQTQTQLKQVDTA